MDKKISKYNFLWKYLHSKDSNSVTLSFEEIKNILGFPIDHSFLNCKKELEEYGYKVEKIYLKEKKISFLKI